MTVFHGLAFLRGGMTAFALRSAPLVHVNMHCRAEDGVVAFAGIMGTVCGDAADRLVRRDLAEQIGQDRRITDGIPVISPFGRFAMQIARRAVPGADFQGFLVNPKMDLPP
ncbi:hypothetical protein AL036_19735 [Salipiger aestuarii]|nr:hypothetical protein AL036_19735 [Salipiger aestuarii]